MTSPGPLVDRVIILPRGLVWLLEQQLEQVRRDHEAGKVPPFAYTGEGWADRVRVRLIVEEANRPSSITPEAT